MINLNEIINTRSVELYDGSVLLAQDIHEISNERVTLFSRKPVEPTLPGVKIRTYKVLLEAADCVASVCMLNDRAIKVLVAMYPSAPKYVLVRLALRTSWLLGSIGLFRRLIFGLVRIEGVTTLPSASGRGRTYWLVLEQSGGAVHQIPVLPKAVGIPTFLEWLRVNNIKYIVLRFFEYLPQLHREAGDLDILVADEDRPKIERFLTERASQAKDDAGDIRIGLHSVSGEPGMIPYYPPPLARQMLDRAIAGPAGSRIPEPKDALHSLMYHTLYHSKKGYASGIPSTTAVHTDKHPENDYAGMLQAKADALGVTIGKTMEEMDEYLANEGWRPKIDTLAKIAETNVWVRDRFFSNNQKTAEGIAVFILRQWVLEANLADAFIEEIKNDGFIVLRKKVLTDEERKHVHDHLRGGTWGTDNDGNKAPWQPAVVLVMIDPQCARLPASYAAGFEHFRIRKLKERLRKRFDSQRSSVHSTDNTIESWEYIETCFPNEIEKIRDEVATYTKPSFFALWRQLANPVYLKHSVKHSTRSFLIRRFLS